MRLNSSTNKNLQLEDDDNFDYHGYWHNQITRMVEETDEEFNKRIARNNKSAEEMKQRKYESYLKLKEEFENGKGDKN